MKHLSKILSLIVLTSFFFSNCLFAQRWEKVRSIPQPYLSNDWLDAYFLPSNPDYGWICGFSGMVIRTTDGGNTWSGARVPGANQLESIHFPSVNVGYTSGVEGIYKSTNGGATWFNITPSSSSFNLWGCYFVDNSNGFVIGGGCTNGQYFWRTTDGGTTWNYFKGNLANSGLTDLIVYSMFGVGYASSSGWIWQTTDGGLTWSPWSDTGPNDWQEEITRVGNSFCVPTSTGCTGGGGGGGIRFSTDNGLSWNRFNTGARMFGSYLLTTQTAWACGDNRNVWHTTNAGQDWILKNCGFDSGNLDDIWFINSNKGWIVGDGVYHLADPLQQSDKSSLSFNGVCIPDKQIDQIILDNINFDPDDVSLSIINDATGDFSIETPNSNFVINSCESKAVEIAFEPKDVGSRTATLHIEFGYGTQIDVNLSGYGLKKTASPSDTLIKINPAYCGNKNIQTLDWTAQTTRESISKIDYVSGSKLIANESTLPFLIGVKGIKTIFSAEPIDTGWVTARFKCDFMPCSGDTFITVKAYGVSPIISSDPSRTLSAKCGNVTYDTIPIFNKGNDDLIISSSNIVENNTNFSILAWEGISKTPVVIPPDTLASIIIRYVYNTGNGNLATLRLLNNDMTTINGIKSPYDISLFGEYGKTEITVQDSIIDFGNVCLGEIKTINIYPKNTGTNILTLDMLPIDTTVFNIDFDSLPIDIDVDDSIRATITLKPQKIGRVQDTISLLVEPCNQVLQLLVQGNVVSADFKTNPGAISQIVQTNKPFSTNINIRSTGTEDIIITDIDLGEPANNIKLDYEPTLPKSLKYDGNVDFNITITSLIDTVYDGVICFHGEGYCLVGKCIPIHLESYSSQTEFLKDSIDFGFIKCTAQQIVDTLEITNSGFATDTIVKLEINPTNTPFRMLNTPSLPYPINDKDTLSLLVEFDASVEGDYSASITMGLAAAKIFEKNISIKGQYHTATSTPNTKLVDFGDVEQCDAQKTKQIIVINTGTLQDSILIRKNNNIKGIVNIPDDFLIIPPMDSAVIDIYLNPNQLQVQDYQEQIILESQICPNIDTIDIKAKIFHNLLTYSPNSLDFGSVWVDELATQQFVVKNESNYPKDVIYMEMLQNGNEYNFKNSYNFPIHFNPMDSLIVPITFKSSYSGHYTNQIRIFDLSICLDTTYIDLVADVPKEIYETSISLDDYLSRPGVKLSMPLHLSSPLSKLKHQGINFQFSFDPWLFYPTSVIVKNNSGNQVTVPFNYQNGVLSGFLDTNYSKTMLFKSGDIMWINGTVFLSNPISTPIHIDEFLPISPKTVTIDKKDGSIKLIDVCMPLAGFHLVESNNNKVVVLNNPINNGQLSVNIKTDRKVKIALSAYNITGIDVLSFNSTIPSGKSTIKLDVSDLSAGCYFLKIDISDDLIIKRFIILK